MCRSRCLVISSLLCSWNPYGSVSFAKGWILQSSILSSIPQKIAPLAKETLPILWAYKIQNVVIPTTESIAEILSHHQVTRVLFRLGRIPRGTWDSPGQIGTGEEEQRSVGFVDNSCYSW